ncbi:MAG: peptidylprolyl isomerase [Chloroflexia bacterium]
MKRRWLVVGLTLLVGISMLVGCGTRARTVAVVNGVILTDRDLDREMRHTRAVYLAHYNIDLSDPKNADLLAQVRREALERIIDQELVRQIAAGLFPPSEEGQPSYAVEVADAEVEARAAQYEAQAGGREELLTQNGFESYGEFLDFVRGELRVEKLTQAYGLAEQVHLRHIVVATEEEARQVLARLRAGEDFAKVAQEVSLDKGTADKGGEIGWIGRGSSVPAIEQVAFSLAEGQLSEPVQTSYGFHILQVLERQSRPDPMVFQEWFESLKARATIERLGP